MTLTMDILTKVKARLLTTHAFWAAFIYNTPLVADPTVPTAATDGRRVLYNPAFLDRLGSAKLVEFVLMHELAHIMFLHVPDMRRMPNPDKANIAMDHAINLFLKAEGFTIWDRAHCDPQYTGMAWTQIYPLLPDPPPQPQGGGGDGEGEAGDGVGGGFGRDVRPGDGADAAGGMSEEARYELQREIQGRVAQAWAVAKIAGRGSAALEKLIDQMLQPEAAWYDLLADFLLKVVPTDESWLRRNRRYRDVVLPGRHGVAMGEIVIIGDASGSMTDRDEARILTEVTSIRDLVHPERVRVVWCDTEVTSEQVFEDGDEIVLRPTGGGGTDMRVALDHITQYNPIVAVLMTDGYTPWPSQAPEYPLITCCTSSQPVPFGQVVRVTA